MVPESGLAQAGPLLLPLDRKAKVRIVPTVGTAAVVAEVESDWARSQVMAAWLAFEADVRRNAPRLDCRAAFANDVVCLSDDTAPAGDPRQVPNAVARLRRRDEQDLPPWTLVAIVTGGVGEANRAMHVLARSLRGFGLLRLQLARHGGVPDPGGHRAAGAIVNWLLRSEPHVPEVPLAQFDWLAYVRARAVPDAATAAGASAALFDACGPAFAANGVELGWLTLFAHGQHHELIGASRRRDSDGVTRALAALKRIAQALGHVPAPRRAAS